MECKRLSQDFVEDADLVTIKSAAEDAFVNTEMFFRKDNIESSGNFWLGMAKAKSGRIQSGFFLKAFVTLCGF